MADLKKDNEDNKDDLFSNINPEELSPELKETYKSMQGDYTRKTQAIADLRKGYEDSEAKFEEKLSYLEDKVVDLRNENENLKKKDAILLAKTINVIEKEKREHSALADDLDTREKDLKKKEDEIVEKSVEVVQSEELQSTTSREFITTETFDQTPMLAESEDSGLEGGVSTDINEQTGYRKKICPNCGNTNNAQIREIDDKTRIIYPGFYAKKYKCGQCATEWNKD